MSNYTVIPDIHADPERLSRSLATGAFSERLAFLGDFIDAGKSVSRPDDAEVLARVRRLIEDDDAVAVMGNHELNAILFHRLDSNGQPLRARDDKNRAQHRSFIERFGIGSDDALDWTEWFLTLPLWRDLGGLRLVHARWSDTAISTIAARRPDGRLRPDDLEEVARKETPFARAVDLLLSGPETALPAGIGFHDNSGHYRTQVRIAWWRADAPTWRAAALSVPNPECLPETEITDELGLDFYGEENPPVLVGHYKMRGAPRIETPQAACLDYPDTPCVYRWSGEQALRTTSLISTNK